jgi:hypothetical protein
MEGLDLPIIPPAPQLRKYLRELGSIFPKGSLRSWVAMACWQPKGYLGRGEQRETGERRGERGEGRFDQSNRLTRVEIEIEITKCRAVKTRTLETYMSSDWSTCCERRLLRHWWARFTFLFSCAHPFEFTYYICQNCICLHIEINYIVFYLH